MSLTSPITLTIGGVAHVLSRISEQNYTSVYRKKDVGLQIDLNIRHSYEGKANIPGRVERHNVELVYTTFDVAGVPTTYSYYGVWRVPQNIGAAPVVNVGAGLMTWLLASTNAISTALVSWES